MGANSSDYDELLNERLAAALARALVEEIQREAPSRHLAHVTGDVGVLTSRRQ